MQGSLGWLLLLDAAHRAQSNSVLTPCAMCVPLDVFHRSKFEHFYATSKTKHWEPTSLESKCAITAMWSSFMHWMEFAPEVAAHK
jgi:hypothetical protein